MARMKLYHKIRFGAYENRTENRKKIKAQTNVEGQSSGLRACRRNII